MNIGQPLEKLSAYSSRDLDREHKFSAFLFGHSDGVPNRLGDDDLMTTMGTLDEEVIHQGCNMTSPGMVSLAGLKVCQNHTLSVLSGHVSSKNFESSKLVPQ